ncbi:lytic transglycosylase domain-containing protein [Dissulfurirhabdus thermomarina]|uniref:Lytic transglycosylase domain-containing protein n=1 Tax=Dissulfurirhabdus thermomarina TaxID=1765737 RepID=A0A6N9TNK7_DISTH|nr:lytic transglycosylase domain-containing protein [Dissulfurirhabdus thermomarina]NDY42010.1 lytic transglycosylase domain-containing protein [Dissulfurirhabdus thermomarina]NMX24005.1 lytic transglycosylase domain-containing protein [Dissulfurirhabdus thermomarina]
MERRTGHDGWGVVSPAAAALAALVIVSAAAAPALAGGLYAYVDSRGVLHVTNVPTDPRYRPLEAARHRRCRERLDDLITRAARAHGLDPALVRAVIHAESAGNPLARSRKGAMGLMQLMPETAEEVAVADPFDPAANIRGGVAYLKKLLDRFGGNVVLALAAYNAGPNRVEAAGGVPPIPETRAYIRRVIQLWERFRRTS